MRNVLVCFALSFFIMSGMTIVYTFSRGLIVHAAQQPLIILPITNDAFIMHKETVTKKEYKTAAKTEKEQPTKLLAVSQFIPSTRTQNPYAYGLPKEETQTLLLLALGFFYCGVILLTAKQLLYLINTVIRAEVVKFRHFSPFVAGD